MQWQSLWSSAKTRWQAIPAPTKVRSAVLGGAGLAIVIVGLKYLTSPHWTPLYTNLSASSAGSMTSDLSSSHIPYTLAHGGGTILVPKKDVAQARIDLAEKGLPHSNSGANFPKPGQITLGETNTQIQLTATAALETELAHTIGTINGVRSARVVLTQPPSSLFGESSNPATASVFVTLNPGVALSAKQVTGIQNLVAAAMNGLTAKHVTVVNQNGAMLSGRSVNTAASNASSLTAAELAATTNWDNAQTSNIESMLDQVYGPGSSVARVHVALNFQSGTTHIQKTGTAAVSQKETKTSKSKSSGTTTKATGTAGNTPTYPLGSATGPSSSSSTTTITHYTVPTTKQILNNPPGSVTRETVAVVINHTLTAAQRKTVQTLVAKTAGTNVANVAVSGVPFNVAQATNYAKQAARAQRLHRDMEIAIAVALALVALIVAWRWRRKAPEPVIYPEATQLSPVSTASRLPDPRERLASWSEENPQNFARVVVAMMEDQTP